MLFKRLVIIEIELSLAMGRWILNVTKLSCMNMVEYITYPAAVHVRDRRAGQIGFDFVDSRSRLNILSMGIHLGFT
jgi:hypothetical protein